MLIILPEPVDIGSYDMLAINLNSYDQISIQKRRDGFALVLLREFAPDQTKYYLIAHQQTYEQVFVSFRLLVEALKRGEQVFEMP